MARLILASNSPRRKEILEQAGIDFEILSVEHKEYSQYSKPEDMVKDLALQKAEATAGLMEKELKIAENKMIVGADTVVVQEHKILGKPIDRKDAFSMLHFLQGRTHQVFTGIAVIVFKDGRKENFCFAEKTLVKVCSMDSEEIYHYIAMEESMDKAGAYAIQGKFAPYIEGITGDYYNVVGFPLSRFYQEMKSRGFLDNLIIS